MFTWSWLKLNFSISAESFICHARLLICVLSGQHRDGVRRRRRCVPAHLRVPEQQAIHEGEAHLEDRHSSCARSQVSSRTEHPPQRHEKREYFPVQGLDSEAWRPERLKSGQKGLALHTDRNALLREPWGLEGPAIRSEVWYLVTRLCDLRNVRISATFPSWRYERSV